VCRTHDVIILVGDFNLPNINWSDFEAPNDDIHDVFLDFCVQRCLHRMVKECTRDNSCIDLVLVSDVFMVFNMNVQTPFSTSDYCMVDFELLLDQTGFDDGCPPMEYYYDYDKNPWNPRINGIHC